MAKGRISEKAGWILGWSGGFLWVPILIIVMLVRGDVVNALLGTALLMTAGIVILMLAPWRFPAQPYWKLMLPIYLLFILSLAWAAWLAGGIERMGLSFGSLFLLLPVLLPFYLAGGRRWIDTGDK
jgi:hypothetical protein